MSPPDVCLNELTSKHFHNTLYQNLGVVSENDLLYAIIFGMVKTTISNMASLSVYAIKFTTSISIYG